MNNARLQIKILNTQVLRTANYSRWIFITSKNQGRPNLNFQPEFSQKMLDLLKMQTKFNTSAHVSLSNLRGVAL